MALPTRHKLVLTVLGVIFAALGIMLVIALILGNRPPNTRNNSSLQNHSAGVPNQIEVRLGLASAPLESSSRGHVPPRSQPPGG